jgi:transposase
LEALLEEAHIKLSSLVSDLLGVSARWMLHALAAGETDPAALATLADGRLRATPEQLCDALGACQEMNSTYRRLLKMALEDLAMMEKQIGQLDQEIADLLRPHQDQVQRLAEVPGLGVDSAQQIIAEVGVTVATFPSERDLPSGVGACTGDHESAGVSHGYRSRKATVKCVLNQAANAAVKYKGSIFQILYRGYVPRLGHNQTIGVIAHRLCRLIWKILNRGVSYEERGPSVCQRSRHQRAARMMRELGSLGCRVDLPNPQRSVPA